jgi:hypothetical protein
MLVVESATAILNLIAGVPEIYIRSVEIPIADCRVVGKTSRVVIYEAKVPEMALPTFILIVIYTSKSLQKGFIYQSVVEVE